MRRSLPTLWCLLAFGCAAGPSAPEAERARWSDPAAARSAQIRRIETEYGFTDVPEELLATESGRVLAKAISAHGGRRAWLGLSKISYTRTRQTPARGSGAPQEVIRRFSFTVDPEGFSCGCRADRHEPHMGAGGGAMAETVAAGKEATDRSTSGMEIGEETYLVLLPFVLMDPRLRLEYLGIEANAKTGVYYEKVRASWKDSNRPEWLIASFERGTGLLARVLIQGAEGALGLYVFTEWKDVAGVRFAVRRDVHVLDSVYGRWKPGQPEWVESLSDLVVETVPVEER